jgi:hypothetical protein
MTTSSSPSLGSSIAAFFKGIAGVIAADATGVVVPLVQAANTNIAKNPTLLNAAAQLSSVQVQVISAAPALAQEVLGSTAGALNDLLQLAVTEANAFKAANPLPATAAA